MALTKCTVPSDVIGALGTTPEERGLTTQEFKDKFDEMPKGIKDYLNNTLTPELDTHLAEKANKNQEDTLWSGNITISTTPTQITVSKNVKDYNYIEVGIGTGVSDISTPNAQGTVIIKNYENLIPIGDAIYRGFIASNEIKYKYVNVTTIEMVCATGTINFIRRIKGIKLGA